MPTGSAHGMRRVFVALAPPPAVAVELREAAAAALADEPAWRLPAATHLHLTLAFLGETPEKRLEELDDALAVAVGARPAPRLALRGTGAFPGWSRPRVLWAGIAEERGTEGRLVELQADVAEGLRRARFRFDEKEAFVPHVTLARPRKEARGRAPGVPDAFRRLALELAWRPEAVLCVESRLGAPAPERYPVRARYPLDR